MGKIKYILIILLFTYLVSPCYSQSQEIKIGEKVPDLEFSQIFNYKSDHLKFSDFKGKFIILDFWGIYCGSCIEEFPHLDSLQKKFGDQIQIIPVSRDTKDALNKFFKTHKYIKLLSTPYISGDRSLEKLFPHTGVPFQAWIDPQGKLLQLSPNFSETNLKQLIDSGKITTRRAKRNVYVNNLFDDRWKNLVTYSAVILKYQYSSGLHIEGPKQGKGIAEIGSVKDLYLRAYDDSINHKLELYRPGRIIFNVPDASVYDTDIKGNARYDWLEKYGYGYQLCLPATSTSDPFEYMKEDLNRYFGLKSEIKEKFINCYVLKRTSTQDKLLTKGLKPSGQNALQNYSMNYRATGQPPKVREVVNQPFSLLINSVQQFVEYGLSEPFIDDTGIIENIDFTIDGKVVESNNIILWNNALRKFDLALQREKREIKVLVISNK